MSPTILPNILSTKTPPFHMTLTFSSTYVVKAPLSSIIIIGKLAPVGKVFAT